LAGCQGNPAADINRAAIERALAETASAKPTAPAYCTDPMPKVVPKLGEPVYITQLRWLAVREQENKRDAWCNAQGFAVPAGKGVAAE